MKIHFQFDQAEKARLLPILLENIRHAESLGLPRFPLRGLQGQPLAVIGGGPSVRHHIDTLRNWPGERWAINGAFPWCMENGIDATFFSVDAAEGVSELCKDASKAIVACCCHPKTFEALAGAEVFLMPTPPHPETVSCGPTSASTVPDVATKMGFGDVTFFGCESSYEESVGTHVYMNEPQLNLMIVTCNNQVFATEPEYISQAECLAEIILAQPSVFKEKSGGLLRAMVEGGDWDCVGATDELIASLTYEKAA